ncbi:MAG: DUF6335 family protein [Acidobacteriota bacterium]|nr:DUF6335 family protein [Acidobacteriota bacterium]
MARKKPARPAKKAKKAQKKVAPRAAARKIVKKAAKKAKATVKKGAKTAKAAARKAGKSVKRATVAVKKTVKKAAKKAQKSATRATRTATSSKAKAVKAVKKTVVTAKAVKAGVTAAVSSLKKPNLDRPRKTVADIHGIPSSLGMAGLASAAHSGGEELRDTLKKNNSASPRLTGGDIDANWQNAEAQGDESPGGDNPTPDQDVVDEIGRALGVEYADDEELQGGAEIAERDTHRWELDPASKDDFEDED